MRCQRETMSISVWLRMCPMCRPPVTFGGGSRMVNADWALAPGTAAGWSNSRSLTELSPQHSPTMVVSYALRRSIDINYYTRCPPRYHSETVASGCRARQKTPQIAASPVETQPLLNIALKGIE